MVINFNKGVSGYYHDKKSNARIVISENPTGSYFDSNIYPQLIRWLPLKDNYSSVISIFDYNPSAKIGVITATIKKVEKTPVSFNGRSREVWKVTVTDDISENMAISTYCIDSTTRKVLRQETDVRGRKMIMESIDEK